MKHALSLLFAISLLSECSTVFSGCIADIKANAQVGQVVSAGGLVSADLSSSPTEPCCYISDTDGARVGIKLKGCGGSEGVIYGFDSNGSTTGLAVGADCAGEMELTCLPNTPQFGIPHGPQSPYLMANRCIGGGPFCWDPLMGQGQRGPDGCHGLNNVGMLIRTCGSVVREDPVWGCFYIDDGTCRETKCCARRGIAVTYQDIPHDADFRVPDAGTFVTVTGISSLRLCDCGGVHSVIRLRHPTDLQTEHVAPAP
jgi:hypothetical protein